MTVAKSTN